MTPLSALRYAVRERQRPEHRSCKDSRVSAAMATIGAIASLLRGKQYIQGQAEPVAPPFGANSRPDVLDEAREA